MCGSEGYHKLIACLLMNDIQYCKKLKQMLKEPAVFQRSSKDI